MNRFFAQRRNRLLTYQAMREGKISSTRRIACPKCEAESSALEWNRALQVCPRCGYHAPIGAYYRLSIILDPGSFQELEERVAPADPLGFPGYPQKLKQLEGETGLRDAVVTALGTVDGKRAVFGVLDGRFLMGSMGTAVGEILTRSRSASTAFSSASRADIMPSCSPVAETRRTSLSRISSLI